MRSGRKVRALLVVGALLTAAFGLAPARAAGGMACEIVGTVTLTGYENLLLVNGGSGTMNGTVACEGSNGSSSLSGTGAISGSFKFCKHASSTSHTPECNDVDGNGPPPQPPEEHLWNGVGSNTPLIAHVVASFAFQLTNGSAASCSFDLNGHTLGVLADLTLSPYTCTGVAFVASSARAQAVAEPIIIPGGVAGVDCATAPVKIGPITLPTNYPKACFQQLTFVGGIQAS